ncbi:bifunctional glutamate N-acetyltransferase/amino-acid acetyltransferase ArgJ [Clostridia bacterium]|nr:bifunctional glutamate N-acetyltransferase/amino-acid acetyltransferase ArgJ [Clostridia bacterium]
MKDNVENIECNSIPSGSVTSPIGFKASGVHCGLKKVKTDMAIVYSDCPCSLAAVFTKNVVAAAPVLYGREMLTSGRAQAVVVNAGNANACTGEEGYKNAVKTAELAGRELGIDSKLVMVSSTGVIGYQLPMEKIEVGIKKAVAGLSDEGGSDAAQAIMTTDTMKKEIALQLTIDGKQVTLGGMSKGSGMIHPNMATMLGFVTTDANIEAGCLQKMLKEVADKTFNMITVDGDTSTNDSLFCLANGMADNQIIRSESDPAYADFYQALYQVCRYLAVSIAKDGEGATKLVTVEVSGAATETDARTIAKSICGSNLVKTAVFGEDANWGRVLCAAGYSGVQFDPYGVDISMASVAGEIMVAKNGAGIDFSEQEASSILKEKEIIFNVSLREGKAQATAWCCDFSYDYVRINADYRS